jgi:membrane fusion protein, multidrug efflux system
MLLPRLAKSFTVVLVAQALVANAQMPDKPLAVIVQAAAVQELKNDIEALGNLYANESTVLTAKTTKTVTQINFADGQRVSKGAILVEMTNNEEAALMEAANYNVIEAKKQLDRAKSLSATGAVPAALLDQHQRDYETSRAQLRALEARLKDLRITAPFNGVVGIRSISVGSLITPGQEIVTLNDDSKMKLDFTVPAIYLRSLRVGLPIEANSHDLENKIFKGVISSIDNKIDEATRSIKVRALVENPQHELKQGMLMSLVIRASSRQALAISESALVPMGSNNFVFVLQKNALEKTVELKQKEETQSGGKHIGWLAEKRQIKIGKRYPGRVEVLEGLREGDKVVTHGLQKIHDGQMVNILAEQHNDPNRPTESLADLLKQKKQ